MQWDNLYGLGALRSYGESHNPLARPHDSNYYRHIYLRRGGLMELKGLEGLSLAGSSVTEDGLKHLKYRHLCKYGMTDHSPNYKELKV